MTHNEIKKILNQSCVNPKEPSKWKVLADIGRPEFYVDRAIECLRENDSDDNIKMAITLLAMARLTK